MPDKTIDYKKADLRLRCLEPFVKTGSTVSLTKGQVFDLAERAFKFVTETHDEKSSPVTGS